MSGNKYRTSHVTELDKNTSNDTRLVNTSKSFDGNMYEAFVTTNVNLNSTDRLFVYICNSITDIPAKPLRQIVVMVEDESKDSITTLLKPTYYREYDDVRLVCTNEKPLFMLWKRDHETIGYYHEGKSDVLKPGYELDKDGSLLINKFSHAQEDEYVCIYNNGRGEDVKQHNIKTVASRRGCCGRCEDRMSASDKAVLCDICKLWFHKDCEGLNEELYAALNKFGHKGSQDIPWQCKICKRYASGLILEITKMKQKQDKMEVKLLEIENKTKEAEKSLAHIGDKVSNNEVELKSSKERLIFQTPKYFQCKNRSQRK
ncbi:hypothetical protein BSL78_22886 [Apostichopus japonicus]|uniref:PHD-type domain-containing protein n=1 Tax=Stichopus japonicus TaxID=307972 RepID=A0A2G8JWY2_STIJA|nr:hypothetical protein BSL78_22886 [Apostichopus japonicus]